MKWILLGIWIFSILYIHFRGQIRLSIRRQLLDHSILLAPLNLLIILASAIPRKPFIPITYLPKLQLLEDNWMIIREEALNLSRLSHIKAPENHNDIGFNSFFKHGWKRFYLKWYASCHPSAQIHCPNTVSLLNQIPEIKAAMFAELPPGGKLNPHRDPFAGSLRYHLGLTTPNDNRCFINVDGISYSWADGKGVLFDETYVHEAINNTNTNRIILFCDVTRPLKWSWVNRINAYFGAHIMSAASSPNNKLDKIGAINYLAYGHWLIEQKRRALKNYNRTLYKGIKLAVMILLGAWFIRC
jgi:beta-hydroxylase